MLDYETYRYGSGDFADERMMSQAGLYHSKNGLFIGNDERGRSCFSSGQSAVLLCGGARSGKGNFIIPWLVDGHYHDHIISMDWKGQNGSIAQLQLLQGRHVINFAPRKGRPVVSHRINATSYIHANSPTLIPDTKMFAQDWLPLSGSKNGEYFEGTGQRWIEATAITLARIDGQLTLPRLTDAMAQFGTLSDEWLAIEEIMAQIPEPSIRQVVEEINEMRTSEGSDTGGFNGVKGEIAKSFACMSDPDLREAVSPPYDFCFSDLCKDGAPPYLINIMEMQEFAKSSGPVIRSLYTNALIHKRRAIGSRPQVWLLDECTNVGAWPSAIGWATYGPGYGIRPIYVTQSMTQLNNMAPGALNTLPNSCGTQIYIGIRDYQNEAERVSKMLGIKTIEVEDFRMNETSRIESETLMMDVVLGKVDPVQAGFEIAQKERMAAHKSKAARPVLTADEIMNLPNGNALVFMPGVLERPALTRHLNYWERRDLAGRYLPDPFHPTKKHDVQVQTLFGKRYRRVIRESIPRSLANRPQYRSGEWSYVEGYRPL